jgi:hypothetical protein
MPRGVSALDAARLQRRLWTPRALQGQLAFWVDANDPSTIATTGGVVSAARDKTGRGGAFGDQGNATWRPALGRINGRQTLSFSAAAGNGLRTSTAFDFGDVGIRNSTCCAYAVLRMNTGSPDYGRVVTFFDTVGGRDVETANACVFLMAGAGWLRMAQGGLDITFEAIPYDTLICCGTVVDGTDIFLVEDGNPIPPIGGAGRTMQLGAGFFSTSITRSTGSSEPCDGHLAEALVVDAYPAKALLRRIEGYLHHKWGIPGRLPASHPYRNSPPLIEN